VTGAAAGAGTKGRARSLALISAVCLAAGAALVGRHLYLEAKAATAAVLIDRVWSARLEDGRVRPPWPWADFAPIARVEVRRLGIDRPILSDASGRTLAFGLGHVPGSARPGEPGACVIVGHRDTWAAFLRDLRTGEEMVVRTPGGGRRYRITGTAVVDAHDFRLAPDLEVVAPADRLILTTCWPFDAVRHGPLRYVVFSVPVPSGGASPLVEAAAALLPEPALAHHLDQELRRPERLASELAEE
jgi:sortase A